MKLYCFFCGIDLVSDTWVSDKTYECKRCGFIWMSDEAALGFDNEKFSDEEKHAISITLRNEWERKGRKGKDKKLTLSDLRQIVSQFKHLDPIEKMDHALINLEKSSEVVGKKLTVTPRNDYPYYYCIKGEEILSILSLLFNEDFTSVEDPKNPHINLSITAKGYQRLREIQKPNKESRYCFVAMWFAKEMNDVYESTIKPAIEFIEEGEIGPKYEAVKIDNVEHINDINDEIIGQIRRSKFMVCDLTGYRGGVYFEAGFAYGLGLDVIYTCRKDWTKEEILKNKDGDETKTLLDYEGREIVVKKEGVHFDLAHRNRIEWEPGNLGEFRDKLTKRIKANIY